MSKRLRAIEIEEFGGTTPFATDLDDWHVEFRMRKDTRGAWVVGELRITPHPWRGRVGPSARQLAALIMKPVPQGGIGPALLRRIRLGAEARYARTTIKTQDPDWQSALIAAFEDRKKNPVGRPATRSMAFYRRVAKRRIELDFARHPRPNKVLEREFGFSQSAMAAVISRCRRKGLLPLLRHRV